jgi:hypothetical protein
MTREEFKEKYRFDFLRCDCCGGDGDGCCDTPFGTYVTDCDTTLLVKDGAIVTTEGRKTTYTLGKNSVTTDHTGWGVDW